MREIIQTFKAVWNEGRRQVVDWEQVVPVVQSALNFVHPKRRTISSYKARVWQGAAVQVCGTGGRRGNEW